MRKEEGNGLGWEKGVAGWMCQMLLGGQMKSPVESVHFSLDRLNPENGLRASYVGT